MKIKFTRIPEFSSRKINLAHKPNLLKSVQKMLDWDSILCSWWGSSWNLRQAAWPFIDALGRLQEASVIRFLQCLIGLCDEGRGSLDALLAVGNLLGQLPKPLSLKSLKLRTFSRLTFKTNRKWQDCSSLCGYMETNIDICTKGQD